MNENIKTFVRFLKENGCYRKYMRNFNKLENIKYRIDAYGCKNINDFFNILDNRSYIDCAFIWNMNNEGIRYWDDVDQEWDDIVYGCNVIKI